MKEEYAGRGTGRLERSVQSTQSGIDIALHDLTPQLRLADVDRRAPRVVRLGLAQDFVRHRGGIPLTEEEEAHEEAQRVALAPTEIRMGNLPCAVPEVEEERRDGVRYGGGALRTQHTKT